MVRLQKYLAACGVASRRRAEELIEAGRVMVNGQVAKLGESIPEEGAEVAVDGRLVTQQQAYVYILFNKPAGVITSVTDTHGRKTVTDCLEGVTARVFPVGRLDLDVEGVLLLTNDGDLAYRLTHPKHEVRKEYVAWVKGKMTQEAVKRLEHGVVLEDGPTAPAKVSVMRVEEGATQVRLTIHEGRKREVKRMLAAVGHPVQSLSRASFAGLKATGLRPGQWRHLTKHELADLQRLAANASAKPRSDS